MKYINNPDTTCTCSNPKHHALWDLEPKKILRSLESVFKNQDIDKLTKDTYKFVANISGFIAHYNINGFKHNYQDLRDFAKDLLKSSDTKNPDYYLDDCFLKDQPLYYKQKVEVLKEIPKIVNKYLPEIEDHFYQIEKESDLALAKFLIAKHKIEKRIQN